MMNVDDCPITFNADNLQDWIKLLEHPKTASTAAGCLVYISNAFVLSERPSVTISKSRAKIVNNERSTYVGPGELVLKGSSTSIKLIVSDDENNANDVDLYAHQMVRFINSHSKQNNPGLLSSLHLVRIGTRYWRSRNEKPVWSDIRRRDKTEQSIEDLSAFLANGDDDECTKENVQMLLNAIISIGHGHHIDRASPLHEAVKAQDLDAVIMLLSHEVNVNSVNRKSFTALYYSVKFDYFVITKTLIVFGSDLTVKRADEEEAEIVSVELAKSDKMRTIIKNVTSPSATPYYVDEMTAENLMKVNVRKGKKTHLMSMDGGGIRGLVLTTILTELDRKIPGIFNHVKWVAGTSTGSILALALAHGKTIDQCRNIYFKFKDAVFTPSKVDYLVYDTNILECFLKDIFTKPDGTQTTMHELGEMSGKKLISTTVDASREKLKTELFKSYKIHPHFAKLFDEERELVPLRENYLEPSLNESEDYCNPAHRVKRQIPIIPRTVCVDRRDPSDSSKLKLHERHPANVRVSDVARCTSAAPTFFKKCGIYIDGGITNNNPTVVLIREWERCNKILKNLIEEHGENHEDEKPMDLGAVISIGTGKKKNAKIEDVEVGAAEKAEEWLHDLWEGLRFGKKYFREIGKSDGDVVQNSNKDTNNNNGAYFRFTPTFEEEIAMNETNNETLIEMMWKTKMYMRDL